MNPVIAMPQMGNSLFRRYMKRKYVSSLRRAGAEVRWIELDDPSGAAEEASHCDGLLLPGGADVDPALYGQKPIEACGKPNPLRDAGETAILKKFLTTGKPILCICRGEQMLNVFCGGTLIQDIKPTQTCKHSDFASRAKSSHSVTLTPGGRLAAVFGEQALEVNSMHHQAVDRVGEGLTVEARSSDGFVEALSMDDHRFCIAVQWHPEHMSRRSKSQRKIFDAFVGACRS